MLREYYRVTLVDRWDGQAGDAMVALHARRSAESIERWANHQPRRPVAVVLTGTDLYCDIQTDASAQRSLALADRLVVLHERAIDDLPIEHRHKALACFQSTTTRAQLSKTQQHLRAVMVGHLRAEKAPRTYFDAARRLAGRPDILFDHIGAALDPRLGAEALAVQQSCPQYRWLGPQAHESARRRIQCAHVLVHTSRIEGGAHVLMEAVCSGTPVIASRISGNVGMLGLGYSGYFELDDAEGLVALLEKCRDDPAILARLRSQCLARAPLFEPAHERATLRTLMDEMLESAERTSPDVHIGFSRLLA